MESAQLPRGPRAGLICGVQFFLAALVSLGSAAALNLMLLPVAVAACAAQARYRLACAAIGMAALAGLLISGQASIMLMMALWSGLGVPLGWVLANRRSYGRGVALVALATSALLTASTLLNWEQAHTDIEGTLVRLLDELDRQGNHSDEELVVLKQLNQNWPNFFWGTLFAGMTVAACFTVSLTGAWLRRLRPPLLLRSGFAGMRPPDWLVWALICAAGLCFADYYWEQPVLRLIGYNTAIGLGAVYYLNGLSVLAYSIANLLRPNLFLYGIGLITALLFSQPVALLGLFDTWGEFRRKVDALVEARAAREEPNDNDFDA
jgi:hypothetical protein